MCKVVHLQYACGHLSPRQWLIAQHALGRCPGLLYQTETDPFITHEQCPSCTDILRLRGIFPDTEAGRQMETGYAQYDYEYRDPRLNYGNQIITDMEVDEVEADLNSSHDQSDEDIRIITELDFEDSEEEISPRTTDYTRGLGSSTEMTNSAALFPHRSHNPAEGTNDYGEFIRWAPDDAETDRIWYGDRRGDDGPGMIVDSNDSRPLANSRRSAATDLFVPPTFTRRNAIVGSLQPQADDQQDTTGLL